MILLCQERPFATRRLVKEDNGRPVRRIYSTGTIGWQNSALDRRKFYDIKLKSIFDLLKMSIFFYNITQLVDLKAKELWRCLNCFEKKILQNRRDFPKLLHMSFGS